MSHPLNRRAAGLLLHPSSLSGGHGIGSLGAPARGFLEFLAQAGMRLWQVLPLGPTGPEGSPYASPSSFAGNPWLVDAADLARDGWLEPAELKPLEALGSGRVEHARLVAAKGPILGRAASRFLERARGAAREEFEAFCAAQAHWLESYARFTALKHASGAVAWTAWGDEEPATEQIAEARAIQFFFSRQWQALRQEAARKGIRLIGDLPLFVAHDSVEVWERPELFDLDASGAPRTVAGCPPDYFAEDGQLWGNPLYRWEAHREEGFAWWARRFSTVLERVDVVRLDHFRGLSAFWEIPADAKTARPGRWVEAPGAELLTALRGALGGLPILAEDLGVITPDVMALRERFELPGMRILQFAFGSDDASNPFLPHNHERRSVVYTGTHDNDTVRGWFKGAGGTRQSVREARAERQRTLRYLGRSGHHIHWDFVRAAFASVADTAIVPVQDVLGLGSEARMNTPGTARGNWTWRLGPRQLRRRHARELKELARLYARVE